LFKKLLIANRGEIALRIVRACREMGIAAVAVYSEADRNSLHVRHADEAYLIGPAPARESYLNGPRIIEVARKAGADALHPGYGFLAENAAFAQACLDAGITWVGPSPESIRTLGDKVQARRLMRKAGIPVVPGSEEVTSHGKAASAATGIGYPIMIKATAGGGGRGIRTVYRPEELPTALEAASQEAASAFGHGALYLEKFLEPVRHIELQIIGDTRGNVATLGERECSIQRRHQKMIEEAPSTAVDSRLRRQLSEMALRAARATGYTSVGTLEFLVDQEGRANFLEMNTRLQVEHPVTELVTGVDMVADQILVAAGEDLPCREATIQGWALECRIAAEDPFNNFLPSVGTVSFVSVPGGPGVRVDSALYDGLEFGSTQPCTMGWRSAITTTLSSPSCAPGAGRGWRRSSGCGAPCASSRLSGSTPTSPSTSRCWRTPTSCKGSWTPPSWRSGSTRSGTTGWPTSNWRCWRRRCWPTARRRGGPTPNHAGRGAAAGGC